MVAVDVGVDQGADQVVGLVVATALLDSLTNALKNKETADFVRNPRSAIEVQLDRRPDLDKQVAAQVARLNFGRQGELRRAAQDDPTLAEALRAATQARTPAELLSFATAARGAATPHP